ncbi:hypothetical protein TrRE_jg10617 [Triparma retinervis]|uniref:Uncharacterized protein n=1 Tax=Triparma retinervis TaxID=2557542 RepID=A0A9W7DLV4_9STRA|nr:hypothetical protein TrRE_jg10617 [Triparma retinervis]
MRSSAGCLFLPLFFVIFIQAGSLVSSKPNYSECKANFTLESITLCYDPPLVEVDVDTELLNSCRSSHSVSSVPACYNLKGVFSNLLLLATDPQHDHTAAATDILVDSPIPHTARSFAVGQRLYVDLSLPPAHPLLTTTTACVYIDLQEKPSWCGEVSREGGSETMYLNQRQTRALGRGLHAVTVNAEKSVFFNMAEPKVEIVHLGMQGPDSVKVTLALKDYDGRSQWEVCLLVDSVPACTSLEGGMRGGEGEEMVVLELENVCFSDWRAAGGGWEVKVTPMILDTNTTKALWLGKEVSVRSRSPSSPSCNVFDLKFVNQSAEESWLGRLGQNGEDGVLLFILRRLMGIRRLDGMNFFEFGAENGAEVNTRLLRERYGVRGLMVDIDYENLAINLRRASVTAETIGDIMSSWIQRRDYIWSEGGGVGEGGLMEKVAVDIISIDIDRNDYWVLKSMLEGGTLKVEDVKVLILEYNSHLEPDLGAISVPYDPTKKWDGRTSYFGASLTAFVELLAPYGLALYHCESHGVNAFFVNERFVEEGPRGDVEKIWREPNFYGRGWRYPQLEDGGGGEWIRL